MTIAYGTPSETIEHDAAADTATVLIERAGPRLRITIDRVEKHNALSRETLAALAAAVVAAGSDEAVGYVVIRGAGTRYFAAGGDLVDLAGIRTDAQTAAFATTSRAALDTIRDCPLPVIAYLNGDALGGGAELAMACDLRVMTSNARIGYVQSRLAISSAWGGGPDLCAAVGSSRALRMMIRGEMVGATEALAIGLCDAVFETDLACGDAHDFFKPIDATPRHVLKALKENVVACRPATRDAARDVEHRNLVKTWTHPAHWDALDRVLARPRT
jgi:enoyl-CoA hydratase